MLCVAAQAPSHSRRFSERCDDKLSNTLATCFLGVRINRR
ncbi:uncharacterized protein METZ01_LOCUS315758 [marine metagenome]|uniref:Uncharacterized protein n=1 Tax=marine metagenome TaxID=408172 RepID=A0A382NNZ7_9ZZZZ